jgi:hypothetical protein
MMDMFDMMLAKDCPLHCAALQGKIIPVNTLLSEECDLSSVDKGGRNVMHSIATGNWLSWNLLNYKFNHKASLHNTESVLEWTPLQYE